MQGPIPIPTEGNRGLLARCFSRSWVGSTSQSFQSVLWVSGSCPDQPEQKWQANSGTNGTLKGRGRRAYACLCERVSESTGGSGSDEPVQRVPVLPRTAEPHGDGGTAVQPPRPRARGAGHHLPARSWEPPRSGQVRVHVRGVGKGWRRLSLSCLCKASSKYSVLGPTTREVDFNSLGVGVFLCGLVLFFFFPFFLTMVLMYM